MDGAFVDANPSARAQASKFTMEEWHALTHDTELVMHPEKPILKDGQELSDVQLHELLRLRRMERQPELAAQLDEIAQWLCDLLGKTGRKTCKVTPELSIIAVTSGSRCCSAAGLSTRTGTAQWKHSFDPGQ